MSLTLRYFASTLSFSKITHNIEFCKFDCCINKCKKRVVEIIRKKSKRSKFKLKNSRKKGKNNNKASQTSKNVKGGNLAGTPRQDKTKLRRVNQYPFTKQFDSIRRNLRQNRNVLFAKNVHNSAAIFFLVGKGIFCYEPFALSTSSFGVFAGAP